MKFAIFIATFAIFHVYPDITILFVFSRSSDNSSVEFKTLLIEILDTLIGVVSCCVQVAVFLSVEFLIVQHIFLDACLIGFIIGLIRIVVNSITDLASVRMGHHVALIKSLGQRCWTSHKKYILWIGSFIHHS